MLTKEERDLLVDVQDRLLELYVCRDYAKKAQDLAQLHTLDREIALVETQGRNFAAGKWQELLRRGRPMTDEATRRRHVREKSVIDHVARDLFKPLPEPAAEKSDHPKSTTDTGLPVEEQVRKEWDPSRGGLPTFLL